MTNPPPVAERVMTVRGDTAQRMHQQGLACRADVVPVLKALRAVKVLPSWPPVAAYRGALGAAGAFYWARNRLAADALFDGRYGKGWRSVAQGLGVSTALTYGMGAFEWLSSNSGFSLGCTSMVFAGEVMADRRPRHVYNHDFPPSFGRFAFVRRSEATDALDSLSVTYSIVIGAICGINEAGLSASVNHAYATDYHSRPALRCTTLVQACLDTCRSVQEAVMLCEAVPVPNGSIFTFADVHGDAAIVEKTCQRTFVRRTAEPPLYVFNSYRVSQAAELEIPIGARLTGFAKGHDVHAASVERHRRFDALLPSLFEEPLTDADLHRLFSDHRDGEPDAGTICRHNDPMGETLVFAQLNARDGQIGVHFGAACQGPGATYPLRE